MAKPNVKPVTPAPTQSTPKASSFYNITKNSMYGYQLNKLTGDTVEKIGPENTFAIVATQLNDCILADLKIGL